MNIPIYAIIIVCVGFITVSIMCDDAIDEVHKYHQERAEIEVWHDLCMDDMESRVPAFEEQFGNKVTRRLCTGLAYELVTK